MGDGEKSNMNSVIIGSPFNSEGSSADIPTSCEMYSSLSNVSLAGGERATQSGIMPISIVLAGGTPPTSNKSMPRKVNDHGMSYTRQTLAF